MTYMLDTNVCIDVMRKKSPLLEERIHLHFPQGLAVSSITLAELEHGVAVSARQEQNAAALHNFVCGVKVLAFDANAARQYGLVRAALEKRRQVIGVPDMFIAGHALAVNLILVTHNTREFTRVDGLTVEDWILPN
ncbi:ribonuclease VapC [Clostridia bacterium]|nr:ribonuclease VapC [Clostridia bacterium]